MMPGLSLPRRHNNFQSRRFPHHSWTKVARTRFHVSTHYDFRESLNLNDLPSRHGQVDVLVGKLTTRLPPWHLQAEGVGTGSHLNAPRDLDVFLSGPADENLQRGGSAHPVFLSSPERYQSPLFLPHSQQPVREPDEAASDQLTSLASLNTDPAHHV